MSNKVKAWFWFIMVFGPMVLIENGILNKWFYIVSFVSCGPLLFAAIDYDKKDSE